MLLIPDFYTKSHEEDGSIPKFIYLTESMYHTLSLSGIITEQKTYNDVIAMREVFADIQLVEWLQDIKFLLPTYQGQSRFVNKLMVELGITWKDIKTPSVTKDIPWINDVLDNLCDQYFKAIRHDKLSGAEVYPRDNRECLITDPLLKVETHQTLIIITPSYLFNRLRLARKHLQPLKLKMVLETALKNVVYSQPVGVNAVRSVYPFLNTESINRYLFTRSVELFA